MFGQKPFNPHAGLNLTGRAGPGDMDQIVDIPGYGPFNVGNQTVRSAAGELDTNVPEDPYGDQRPAKKTGFFGKGLGRDLLGGALDGVASFFGGSPGYGQAQDAERDYQHKMMLARLQAGIRQDVDSPYIKDAEAIGLKRGTPEFARWVTRMRSAPRIIQNDSGIYQDDGDGYGLWDAGGGGAQTQTVDGVTYYNIGGKWYDNPEGR